MKRRQRIQEAMQYDFAVGIVNAAVAWAKHGQDPTHEWAELYDHVIWATKTNG